LPKFWQCLRIRSRATAASPDCAIPGQLEAALFRPQTGHFQDLIEEAAALWESRYTFLAINGWRLTTSAEATYEFLSALYEAHKFTFEALVAWLRTNARLSG
jgi:death-on-curing protein